MDHYHIETGLDNYQWHTQDFFFFGGGGGGGCNKKGGGQGAQIWGVGGGYYKH
jgi:hypothetical protein